jgi:hypothetical protein
MDVLDAEGTLSQRIDALLALDARATASGASSPLTDATRARLGAALSAPTGGGADIAAALRAANDTFQSRVLAELAEVARRSVAEEGACVAARGSARGVRCALPACSKLEEFTGQFKKCSRCAAAMYCSKACQAAHWAEHRRRECTKPAAVARGSPSSSS